MPLPPLQAALQRAAATDKARSFGVADSDGLRALLHNAGREVRAAAESQRFADDAHAIARIQFKVTGLKNFCVAEMNVNLARGGLKNYMGAHGRNVGGCREFYDRAEEEAFAAHVIRA